MISVCLYIISLLLKFKEIKRNHELMVRNASSNFESSRKRFDENPHRRPNGPAENSPAQNIRGITLRVICRRRYVVRILGSELPVTNGTAPHPRRIIAAATKCGGFIQRFSNHCVHSWHDETEIVATRDCGEIRKLAAVCSANLTRRGLCSIHLVIYLDFFNQITAAEIYAVRLKTIQLAFCRKKVMLSISIHY